MFGVLLLRIFIRMAMPLAFFRNAFLGIVELAPSGNRVRHIVSSQDDAVAGLIGTLITTDREQGMLDIVLNAQCTHIFISKSPTFSLRTPILLLAAIRLAAHQKYYSSTNQAENASGAAMRMEKPQSKTPQLNGNSALSIFCDVSPFQPVAITWSKGNIFRQQDKNIMLYLNLASIFNEGILG